MKSIRFQASRVANCAPPSVEERVQVRTMLTEMMNRCSGKPTLRPMSEPEIRRELNRILDSGLVNPKAVPGVPYNLLGTNKRDVLRFYRAAVEESVVELAKKWRDTPRSDLEEMTLEVMLEQGFVFPTECKIKQEPHKAEKLQQERYRIFFAMSMIMELVERVLYQRILDHEIEHWKDLPAKPGIGFTDEMMADLFAYVDSQPGSERDDNDMSGFDWSLMLWLKDLVDDATIDAYLIPKDYANMIRNNTLCAFKIPLMLSDGTLLELTVKMEGEISYTDSERRVHIVWKSGKLTTARDNSWARIALSLLAALRSGAKKEELWAVTMGDDCTESAHQRDYAQYGFRMTDQHITKKGQPFEFCSHLIQRDGDGKLLPWTRTLYRLLSHPPEAEFLVQFQHEMRHNEELEEVMGFLQRIGYLDRMVVPHCGFCILPEKEPEKIQISWMKGKKYGPPTREQAEIAAARALVRAGAAGPLTKAQAAGLERRQARKREKKQRKQQRALQTMVNRPAGVSNKLLQHSQAVIPALSTKATSPATIGEISAWPSYEQFIHAMAHPFDAQPVKAPFSYNDAPTFRTHVARTTVTMSNFTVGGGVSTTFMLFPGWAVPPTAANNISGSEIRNPVGLTAAYGPAITDSLGALWNPGPAPNVDPTTSISYGACGVFWNNNVTSSSSAKFALDCQWAAPWDVPMPYTGNIGDVDLLRWRVTAIAFRIVNQTPEIQRGGEVWTVQPTYNFATDAFATSPIFSVGSFAYEPSLHCWGPCGEKPMTVSAILKPRDLSYWGTQSGNSLLPDYTIPVSRCGNPALLISVNAPAAYSQNYDIQIEYHWEIGGDSVFQISTAAAHVPATKQVFEPTTSHLINNSPTAAPAPGVSHFMEALNKGADWAQAALKHPAVAHMGGRLVKTLSDAYLSGGMGALLGARASAIAHESRMLRGG